MLVVLNIGTLTTFWLQNKTSKKHPPRNEILAKELDLSPEQARKFKVLQDSFFAETEPIMAELRKLRHQMFKQLDNPVETTLGLSEEACAIQQELDKKLVVHFLKLQSICDSTQSKKLSKIFERSQDRSSHKKRPHSGYRHSSE